jgi:hypothetical protein
MNNDAFLEAINKKAAELHINPVLLLSGIEGLYTFKDIPLNTINYEFLDSLILTIFALRIGDRFHVHAQENLISDSDNLRNSAASELKLISPAEIASSGNPWLISFARIINGKSPIRNYHIKALEAAALEINNLQHLYKAESITTIMIWLCNEHREELQLGSLFSSA